MQSLQGRAMPICAERRSAVAVAGAIGGAAGFRPIWAALSRVLRLRRASASRESSDIEGVVVVDIEVSASASSAIVGRVPMLGVLVKVGLHTQQAAKKTEHPLLPPAERWEGGGVR